MADHYLKIWCDICKKWKKCSIWKANGWGKLCIDCARKLRHDPDYTYSHKTLSIRKKEEWER